MYKVTKKKEDGGGASLLVVQDVDFPNAHNAEIINIGISNNGKFIMSADKGTHIIIWSLRGNFLLDWHTCYSVEIYHFKLIQRTIQKVKFRKLNFSSIT